jgi:hypothetical protein
VYAVWGALAGFAFWTFGLTAVYSLPAMILLGRRAIRGGRWRLFMPRLAAVVGGAVVGMTPLVLWSVRHGVGPAIEETLGSAISGASPGGFLAAIGSHALNLVLFAPTVALGLRPPWSPDLLGLPLTPIAAIAWTVLIGFGLRSRTWPGNGRGGRLLVGVALTLVAGFLVTPFGADPSGRYFLPLAAPLAIVAAAGAAELAERTAPRWAVVTVAALIAFQAWANWQAANLPSRMTTQFDAATVFDRSRDDALISFLHREGETDGYTTYWVAYPLAFLSREQLVFIPHLPYHSDFRYTARDDRYPPYSARVAAADRVAYLTAAQPWLDAYLRQEFDRLEVAYRETSIGDYRVFHNLSRVVRPSEIGLGPATSP